MARAKNIVEAGDYVGRKVLAMLGTIQIPITSKETILLNKDTVKSYEVITDDHRKSAASGVGRGLVGGVLLGPVGLLAGGLSAKNKGIYTIAVEFHNGKKSLIEIDDKAYKVLIKNCF